MNNNNNNCIWWHKRYTDVLDSPWCQQCIFKKKKFINACNSDSVLITATRTLLSFFLWGPFISHQISMTRHTQFVTMCFALFQISNEATPLARQPGQCSPRLDAFLSQINPFTSSNTVTKTPQSSSKFQVPQFMMKYQWNVTYVTLILKLDKPSPLNNCLLKLLQSSNERHVLLQTEVSITLGTNNYYNSSKCTKWADG